MEPRHGGQDGEDQGRTLQADKLISNGVAAQLACLDQVLRRALLGALSVYKTIQTTALHRESAIPPMELLLDQRRRSLAIKVHQLDTQHPLHLRVTQQPSRYIKTRLLRAIDPANFHLIEQVDPLLTSPWDSNPAPKERPTATPKARSREDFQRWLTSIPPPSIVVYTDGSKEKEGTAAGAYWVGYWASSTIKIFCGHRKLANQEVFDAEARAALLGLHAALKDPKAQHSTDLHICLDNLEAVQQLQGQPTGSSQSIFKQFQEAAQTWPHFPRAPGIQPGRVQLRWSQAMQALKATKKLIKKPKWAAMVPWSSLHHLPQ